VEAVKSMPKLGTIGIEPSEVLDYLIGLRSRLDQFHKGVLELRLRLEAEVIAIKEMPTQEKRDATTTD
jgi:hypothetical protein